MGSAASERITGVSGQAAADGASVASVALGVDTARSRFANVDAARSGALLGETAILVPGALRSASGDGVRFGEESRFTTADGDT